jgi:Rrf2 family protein
VLAPSTGYAALALATLAHARGQSVKVRYLADRCAIPGPYLSKIIHTLARAGVVGTRRGAGGGVWLLADPDTFTLHRLCQILEDPALNKACVLGLPICRPGGACLASDFCAVQRDGLIEFLKRTTLAQFVRQAIRDAPRLPGSFTPAPAPAAAPPRVIRLDDLSPP